MEKSSLDFDRTIIEASALLVTLLFIVLQVGDIWRDITTMRVLCIIAFFFIMAILVSTIHMLGEFGDIMDRPVQITEFTLFSIGLIVLGGVFLHFGLIDAQNLGWTAYFLIYSFGAGVVMALSERRRLRKLKQPMVA